MKQRVSRFASAVRKALKQLATDGGHGARNVLQARNGPFETRCVETS